MMRRFGWFWRTLAALLVLVVGGLVAARYYLSSSAVTDQVRARLGTLMGAPVQMKGAAIGLAGGSTVEHLSIGQPDQPADAEPVLTVRQVKADVSVLGLLSGATPQQLELDGAHLRLHFDPSGNLLTHLPSASSTSGAMPKLILRDARVTLAQEGRPDLDLHNITGTLNPDGKLTGEFTDPTWGTWNLGGALDLPNDSLTLDLKTEDADLPPGRIEQIPFIPPAIWRHVKADGSQVPLGVNLKIALSETKIALSETKKDEPPVHFRVAFANVGVTVPQSDRKPFAVRPTKAVVEGDSHQVTLTGQIQDPSWGDWAVHANFLTRTGAIDLRLDTKETQVTDAKLLALPFVPLSVWKEVRAEGTTPVDLRVRFFTDKPHVNYRVALEPRDTRVKVEAIDLVATKTHGKVLIEDGRVVLSNVEGDAAGGTIHTDAELYFYPESPTSASVANVAPPAKAEPEMRLHFQIAVAGVVLSQLPRNWQIPTQIDGKLTGKADITLLFEDGKMRTAGSGDGEIKDAQVAGFPAKRPIPLHLHSDGKRFRFGSSAVTTLALPLALAVTTLADRAPAPPARPWDFLLEPNEAVNSLTRVIAQLATKTGEETTQVLKVVARLIGPAPPPVMEPGKEPSYLDANLELQDVDLAQLLQRLDLKLPIAVAGRLSFNVQLSIPIDTPRDLRLYKVRGSATLPTFEISGFRMAAVRAQVNYQNGVLNLTGLSGQVPRGKDEKPGTFQGTATVGVSPPGELAAQAQVDSIPLDVFLKLLPGTDSGARGLLSGTVTARAPFARLNDLATWNGHVELRSPQLEVYGQRLIDVTATASVARGVVDLTAFQGRVGGGPAGLAGAPLTGNGTLRLTGPMAYQARARLRDFDLAALGALPAAYRPTVAVAGTASVTARVEGNLQPPAGTPALQTLAGDAQGRDVVIGEKGSLRAVVDSLSLNWQQTDAGLALRDVRARLYNGEVTGTVQVPESATEVGKAELRLDGLDVRRLVESLAKVPFRIQGKASGTVRATLPAPPRPGASRPVTVEVDVSAPDLRVQDLPTDKVHGTVQIRDGATSYNLEGEALGGKFKLNGKLPRGKAPAGEAPEKTGEEGGSLSLSEISIERLGMALGFRDRPRPGGRLSVEFKYSFDRLDLAALRGRGQIRIRNLRWDDSRLASNLSGDLTVADGQFLLRNFGGQLAGGELSAGFRTRLNGRGGLLRIDLRGADSERLLQGFPSLAGVIQGPIDLNLRSSLGTEWNGQGTLNLTTGKVEGIQVGGWRVPFTFDAAPERGHLAILISDSGATVGRGRAVLSGEVRRDTGGLRLRGTLNFVDADLRQLVGTRSEVSSYAQGRVNGRIDFSGSNVQSLKDLTATIQATLHQVQAQQIPGLTLLAPFLGPGAANTTFQQGDLQARLGGGVLRIQRLSLAGNLAALVFEGTVSLGGTLDLDVSARTGSLLGLDPLLLRVLSLQVPPVGPLPVTLALRITEVLANQVVHLRMTGNVRNPQIQVQPARILSDTAARFLLLSSLPGR